MFKLNYASLDLQGDIPCFEFKTHAQMIDFIDEKCINRSSQLVWLLAREGSQDIFISENHLSVQDFLENKYLWNIRGEYFLQEYSSYEEAQKVALSMYETSSLCYINK